MSSSTEIIHLSFSCANVNVAFIIEEKVELSIDMVSFCANTSGISAIKTDQIFHSKNISISIGFTYERILKDSVIL